MVCSKQEDSEDRLDCLVSFCWLKRSSRAICEEMVEYRYQENRLRRQKELLKQEHSPFNDHRISKINSALQEIEDGIDRIRCELVKVGKQISNALYQADTLLSFHDKCQVMGRSHQSVTTQMMKARIPLDTSFTNMVTIYDLECAGKDRLLLSYSPAMPLYTASNEYLINNVLHNKEFLTICEKVFVDMFPYLPFPVPPVSPERRQLPKLRLV